MAHARRGLGRTTPNPVVGACVVTADDVAVGDGSHERAGEAHAEVLALEEAGDKARGSTLYCTLEPCVHTGRTGPCADRIIAAGIARVVAAMEDPNPLVRGRGFTKLREHGIAVDVGVGGAEAARLNQPFVTTMRRGRPFVILKAATSLDARLAAGLGQRTQITSLQAERHSHELRAQVDALAVGSETVVVDDPLLTPRLVYRERPLTRVVFDRRLRTPPEARLFSTVSSGPVIIVTSAEAVRRAGARVAALEAAGASLLPLESCGMQDAVRALGQLEIQSLVLEGGTKLHQAAWDAGIVDYVQLYVGPTAFGGDAPTLLQEPRFSIAALFEQRVQLLGPDVLIEGYVHRPD
jgi:diaminohydroxyphosphoribosylaminopyrimidine deaminase/5-amino-6-(5-phosphoribosylamino)uracil reductase